MCSYQGSDPIVCCPKRNTQPNQQWSNNNNNNNNFNNNQYYQQGGFVNQNQQSPINQINQNYPIQQPNQIYQPNQVKLFNQFDQIIIARQSVDSTLQLKFLRFHTTIKISKKPCPVVIHRLHAEVNKVSITLLVVTLFHCMSENSILECEEYSKLATHSGSFTSLSILTSTQEVNIPTCTYPTGLIVGGEIAKTGEFPHMVRER